MEAKELPGVWLRLVNLAVSLSAEAPAVCSTSQFSHLHSPSPRPSICFPMQMKSPDLTDRLNTDACILLIEQMFQRIIIVCFVIRNNCSWMSTDMVHINMQSELTSYVEKPSLVHRYYKPIRKQTVVQSMWYCVTVLKWNTDMFCSPSVFIWSLIMFAWVWLPKSKKCLPWFIDFIDKHANW